MDTLFLFLGISCAHALKAGRVPSLPTLQSAQSARPCSVRMVTDPSNLPFDPSELQSAISNAVPTMQSAIDAAAPAVESAIDAAGPTLQSAVDAATPILKSAIDNAVPTMKSAVDAAAPVIQSSAPIVGRAAVDATGAALNFAAEVGGSAGSIAYDALSPDQKTAIDTAGSLTSGVGQIAGQIGRGLFKLGQKGLEVAVPALEEGMKAATPVITAAGKQLADDTKPLLDDLVDDGMLQESTISLLQERVQQRISTISVPTPSLAMPTAEDLERLKPSTEDLDRAAALATSPESLYLVGGGAALFVTAYGLSIVKQAVEPYVKPTLAAGALLLIAKLTFDLSNFQLPSVGSMLLQPAVLFLPVAIVAAVAVTSGQAESGQKADSAGAEDAASNAVSPGNKTAPSERKTEGEKKATSTNKPSAAPDKKDDEGTLQSLKAQEEVVTAIRDANAAQAVQEGAAGTAKDEKGVVLDATEAKSASDPMKAQPEEPSDASSTDSAVQ